MRNLKKFLALVLAMMMAFSLMVTVNAASAKDFANEVNPKYSEAVQVLNQLGVFEGHNDGLFHGDWNITRGQVATILCRMVTGKVNSEDYEIYRYIDSPFYDINAEEADGWYVPYVKLAYSYGLVEGYGDGTYRPNNDVTGQELLVMVLRALGYDELGEYSGDRWALNAIGDADSLGLLDNIADGNLAKPAKREMVAEIAFRALAQTYLVEYSEITKRYEPKSTYASIPGGNGVEKTTLGYKVFGLYGVDDDSYDGDGDGTGIVTPNDIVPETAKYGEPVRYWTASNKYVTGGTISVYFKPTANYHNGVSAYTLKSNKDTVYKSVAQDVDFYFVDGDEDTLSPNVTGSTSSAANFAERGAIVSVYSLTQPDGSPVNFVVVKNVYTDKVATALDNGVIALQEEGNVNDAGGLTASLAKGTVVIYHKYGGGTTVDVATVHAAKKTTVTVTDTKVGDDAADKASYFLAGGKKYEYNWAYDQDMNLDVSGSHNGLLDREVKGEPGEVINDDDNVVIYQDDNDYVVYAALPTAAENGGVFLVYATDTVTSAGQNFYRTFYAYDVFTGDLSTIKGGVDCYYYSSRAAASGFSVPVDIYYGTKSGSYWNLTKGADYDYDDATYECTDEPDTMVIFDDDWEIAAGDALGVDVDGDYLVTDDTIFAIANYDSNGMMTNRATIKKGGFKDIGTITKWEGKKSDVIDPNDESRVYAAHYLVDDDGLIYFVFITGGKMDDAPEFEGYNLDNSLLYLVDDNPLMHHDGYDTHDVIAKGSATQMRFTEGLVASEGASQGNWYTYKTNGKGYVSSLVDATEKYGLSSVVYRGGSVLQADTDGSELDIYSAQGNGVYYTLHNNVKIYKISGSKVESITAEKITGGMSAIVAAVDKKGYITVLYVY